MHAGNGTEVEGRAKRHLAECRSRFLPGIGILAGVGEEVSAAGRGDTEKAKEECAIGEVRGGIGDAKARSECEKRYT